MILRAGRDHVFHLHGWIGQIIGTFKFVHSKLLRVHLNNIDCDSAALLRHFGVLHRVAAQIDIALRILVYRTRFVVRVLIHPRDCFR